MTLFVQTVVIVLVVLAILVVVDQLPRRPTGTGCENILDAQLRLQCFVLSFPPPIFPSPRMEMALVKRSKRRIRHMRRERVRRIACQAFVTRMCTAAAYITAGVLTVDEGREMVGIR